MSGFFATQTQTVDLGGGNSAVIRKLTYGEMTDALSAATRSTGTLDIVRYNRIQVETCLVSWAGPGFEGREVKPENIRALPPRVGRKLADAARDLNEDVEDEEGNA